MTDWNWSKKLGLFKFLTVRLFTKKNLEMPSYLLIRKFENSDEFKCQEIIKEFVMSGAKDAFFDGLFREVRNKKNIFWGYVSLFLFRFLFLDNITADCSCLGDCIYILWSTVTLLYIYSSICDIFNICFCLWFTLHKCNGTGECEFKFVIFLITTNFNDWI